MSELNFAGRLKELREGAGLTQQQLAAQIGVAVSSLRNLEQGVNPPKWETVQALADALGVSCESFRRPAEKLPEGKIGRPKKPVAPAPKPKKAEPKTRGRKGKGE